MNRIDWDIHNYIYLRESYEIDNCICLELKKGYFRVGYMGLDRNFAEPYSSRGEICGVDIVEK